MPGPYDHDAVASTRDDLSRSLVEFIAQQGPVRQNRTALWFEKHPEFVAILLAGEEKNYKVADMFRWMQAQGFPLGVGAFRVWLATKLMNQRREEE
mgnify:CR=1 FL=1